MRVVAIDVDYIAHGEEIQLLVARTALFQSAQSAMIGWCALPSH